MKEDHTLSWQHDKRTRYKNHRRRAKKRGITWLFTYSIWRKKWYESGKWEQRGLGRDKYCMARYNDEGPYEYGNTKIITNLENCCEHRLTPEAKAKISANNRIVKIGNKNRLGKRHTLTTRKKISKTNKGKRRSLKHRMAVSIAAKKRALWRQRNANGQFV